MHVERFDNDNERSILSALINDSIVLGAVSARWEFPGPFKSPWCNDVGWWCVKHYKKYGKAPSQSIEGIFRLWATRNQDEDRIKTMDRFLRSLDFITTSEFNSQHTIDRAGAYFNEVKQLQLADAIKAEIAMGRSANVDELIGKYSKIELGSESAIDLVQDKQNTIDALEETSSVSLIQYPGALGNFFSDYLHRGAFISFMAPTKVGKTSWLVDMAYRGMMQERKIAFFSIGDETKRQLTRRFLVRLCRHPLVSSNRDGSWPCVVSIPDFITAPMSRDKKERADVTPKEETFQAPLSKALALETLHEIDHEYNEKSYLRVSVHPNFSVNVLDIRSILDDWARKGFVADAMILDYADNLAPIERKEETRDRINTSWKALRGLSMSHNLLLVTATQTKMEGFKVQWLTKSHFADDKRKIENVDGMIGINQTVEEKNHGIFRLNWAALRGGDFSEEQGCYVAGCLALANPCVKSTF